MPPRSERASSPSERRCSPTTRLSLPCPQTTAIGRSAAIPVPSRLARARSTEPGTLWKRPSGTRSIRPAATRTGLRTSTTCSGSPASIARASSAGVISGTAAAASVTVGSSKRGKLHERRPFATDFPLAYAAAMPERKVVVIGAGAAGLTAALRAAEAGARVTLLNAHPRSGLKILMSGGTRCNVTHREVTERDFSRRLAPRDRAHPARVHARADARVVQDELGVPLKLEETGKYFPVSDDAQTVLDALLAACARAGVGAALRRAGGAAGARRKVPARGGRHRARRRQRGARRRGARRAAAPRGRCPPPSPTSGSTADAVIARDRRALVSAHRQRRHRLRARAPRSATRSCRPCPRSRRSSRSTRSAAARRA